MPPRARTRRARLPLHGFVQDGAVGRVDGAGDGGDILDAEHHEGLVARVAASAALARAEPAFQAWPAFSPVA